MPVKSFLSYLKFEKRFSQHTLTAYETDLKQFFNYLQSQYQTTDVKEVTHFFVRSWMVSLVDKKTTAKSINRKISTLKSFFKFLVKEKMVEQNPMVKIVVPKIPKRLPDFVSTEKMELLFKHVEFDEGYKGARDRMMLELLYGTGMRRAELAGLQDNSIDFGNNTVKVLGKRNKERVVPLTPSLVKMLKNYLGEKNSYLKTCNQPNNFLFLDSHCKQIYPKLIYLTVKKYLGAVTTSKKKSPHVLRHSFATHMLNNGADINAIKELLGHASLAATQVYTHNTIEKLKKVYKQAHPKA
ncbi:MAG: tyrosine recombinase XerC [Bacteroidia bacterium]